MTSQRVARLAGIVAGDFYEDRLDLSARDAVPVETAWLRMPEVDCVERLRRSSVSDRTVRQFLTFIAAMDRARDATRLWNDGVRLHQSHPELFIPAEVASVSIDKLRGTLSRFRVSQRHGDDARAWKVIGRSLAFERSPVARVVETGVGDARELLQDLRRGSRFPMLRGPKVGPMWVRMLAAPGGAAIANIDVLPVSVDVHVRRVAENLGISNTRGRDLEEARPVIQAAWAEAVQMTAIGGPEGIAGTCAALDPALWLFGKYGCSHCERVGQRVPVSRACEACRLPVRT